MKTEKLNFVILIKKNMKVKAQNVAIISVFLQAKCHLNMLSNPDVIKIWHKLEKGQES